MKILFFICLFIVLSCEIFGRGSSIIQSFYIRMNLHRVLGSILKEV